MEQLLLRGWKGAGGAYYSILASGASLKVLLASVA